MNLIIPADYQRLYSAHTRLTPALWEAYRPNALATEPNPEKLLVQWGMKPKDGPASPWITDPELDALHRTIQTLHGGLGLATELDEFLNAESPENALEEIGDACWYLVQILDGLQISTEEATQLCKGEHVSNDDAPQDILAAGAAIVGDIKRIVFYNKQSVRERLIGNIAQLLYLFDNWDSNFNMAQILEWNSYKLRELRYKNGFSNEAAVARLDKPGEQD